ncbi:MAG TPA: ATP-binding cassette domain-containing protein [Bacillota bacterium]|nr:ATP-binding cassette domain-containing protein [Bacillota bacterium]
METILTVNQLNKYFKDKQVLHDISFEVKRGEIMAILGPNGAGKSTTIRNIMGIIQPDEGSITFEGETSIPREKIGYLPEERGLYKNVKVKDIILYLADLKGYPQDKAKERMMHYLEKFDLAGKENSSVEELSKGMGQKVQFIASIIHEPELLILDEPFSGLDPVSQDLFKREIRELANNGTAILLSSHQMNLVEEMCHRLFMISKGKRIIYGDLNDVKQEYANFKCIIRYDGDQNVFNELPSVERIENEEGVVTLYLEKDVHVTKWLHALPETLNIYELTIDRVSLHEIFVDIATGEQNSEEGSVLQ